MRSRAVLFAPGDSVSKTREGLSVEVEAVVLDLEDAAGSLEGDAARVTVAFRAKQEGGVLSLDGATLERKHLRPADRIAPSASSHADPPPPGINFACQRSIDP